jgi:integral membrane protein (TIGR00529 family)
LGLLDPVIAIIISFCILGIMLYKRVNLGITLNGTAIILALLALSWQDIPTLIYDTTKEPITIAVVLATFLIMLLSQLYKETKFINRLSESLSKIIKNPKIVLCVLPAVIGLLPVAGGALMSAPLVDSEAEKLKLSTDKKTYINLWFRHTIFPVYPLSQVLIVTAGLAMVTVPAIILRQIPVVMAMIAVGFLIGFWKVKNPKTTKEPKQKNELNNNLKTFLVAFSPILASIIVAIGLSVSGLSIMDKRLSEIGIDVLIATLVGLIVLIAISRMNLNLFLKPLRSWGIYGITLAAYGAFLLGNVIRATGISAIFETLIASGTIDTVLLLTIVPAVLGALTASALGGVSISLPILGGLIALNSKTASLIYMSAYLGYVISPTHLCFAFTAEYFKCPFGKAYKYVIPSFIATFAATLLVYFLI